LNAARCGHAKKIAQSNLKQEFAAGRRSNGAQAGPDSSHAVSSDIHRYVEVRI
jgi:hypothetical protein